MLLSKLTRLVLLTILPVGAFSSALAAGQTEPTSSESPYVVRSQPGVVTKSILTVGDAVNFKADGVTPYRMVGIPGWVGRLRQQRRHLHPSHES